MRAVHVSILAHVPRFAHRPDDHRITPGAIRHDEQTPPLVLIAAVGIDDVVLVAQRAAHLVAGQRRTIAREIRLDNATRFRALAANRIKARFNARYRVRRNDRAALGLNINAATRQVARRNVAQIPELERIQRARERRRTPSKQPTIDVYHWRAVAALVRREHDRIAATPRDALRRVRGELAAKPDKAASLTKQRPRKSAPSL